MTWLSDHWLDLLGWGGSALLVYSLLQSSVLRLRVLNLVACLILLAFNAFISVWPMVGMNAVLAAINAWFIAQMVRHRHDVTAFDVLEVGTRDPYLQHVLHVRAPDIRAFNPSFAEDHGADTAFLILKGCETVGVVLLRREGDVAHVLLDYVTPRHRDLSPGEFVWRRSGLLAERGIRRVVTPPGMIGAYYGRLGFRRSGDVYVWDVGP